MTKKTEQNQQQENGLEQEETEARRKFLKRAGAVGTGSAVAMLLDSSKQVSASLPTGESEGCGCGGGS